MGMLMLLVKVMCTVPSYYNVPQSSQSFRSYRTNRKVNRTLGSLAFPSTDMQTKHFRGQWQLTPRAFKPVLSLRKQPGLCQQASREAENSTCQTVSVRATDPAHFCACQSQVNQPGARQPPPGQSEPVRSGCKLSARGR